MKEKVLTQDEVSALLDTVGSEKEAGGDSPASKTWTESSESSFQLNRNVFPLAKLQSLTRDMQGALALIYDSFSHKGSSTLSTALRTQIAFKLDSMEQIFYGEYIERLPEPSSIWYLRLDPAELHVAVCLEPTLVNAIISVLMGGSNASFPKGRRNVTELEQSVIESVVAVFCRELKHAWSRLMEVEISIDNRETRPRLLQIYPTSEVIVFIQMTMKVGTTEGEIYWGIPESLLKILQTHLSSQNQAQNRQSIEEAIKQLKQIVLQVPTQLEAQITGTSMRVTDLLELKAGDVVRLEHRAANPISVAVNGQRKFLANVVLSHDRKAIRIK